MGRTAVALFPAVSIGETSPLSLIQILEAKSGSSTVLRKRTAMVEDPFDDENLSVARELARRYGCKFVDLRDFRLQPSLLKIVPVELMFRYNFLPLEQAPDGRIAVAISDPSKLMMLDEISILLGRRLLICVGSADAISRHLKKISE